MKSKLIIIDGNSVMYRSFFALPLLSNLKGEYSNALYGFANEIIKVISEFSPTHIVVCFDVSKHTFRNDIYADYKATRKPMPSELASQIPALHEMLNLMGIKVLEKEGLEADDLIGTIAKRFDVETLILTGDRDAFQLIDETTSVCFMKKGISDVLMMTKDNLKSEYGVEPYEVVDLKALQGDTADNIPGVPGVGPKTATDLILKYKSIDGVYNNIEEISGKLKEKLVEGKELAYLSKKLATINTGVDIDCQLDECEYKFPFKAELKDFFERYSMRSLLKREDIFEKRAEINSFVKISNCDELKAILNTCKNKKLVALAKDDGEQMHFCFDGEEYVCENFTDLLSPGISKEDFVKNFAVIWNDDNILKVMFDAKSLFHDFSEFGFNPCKNFFDVSVSANACLGITVKEPSDIFEFLQIKSGCQAKNLLEAYNLVEKNINENGLKELIYGLEFPLVCVLFNMEQRGFKIDTNALDALENKYKEKIDALEQEIYRLAGKRFNINSPKQLGEVLFVDLHLPKNNKMSTSVDVLEKMLGMHEIIPKILEYRKASKFYGTYLAGMRSHVSKEGFVHTNFNQSLTATGRLSSNEPNLQNLPIRSEEGREIRSMLTASSDGNVLIDADYSQIELRVLAHCADDDFYLKAFLNGEDIHNKTACEIFHVSPSGVTAQMRRIAKVVNFGIVYGISEYGLSADLNISSKEAKKYIEDFYELHPAIKSYMKNQIQFARDNGFVKTLCGRIRLMPDITASNFMVRSRAERTAQNTSIQGSAAEIIKLAMIAVENELLKQKLNAKLIMQVHDELVIDCPKNETSKVIKIVTEKMENAMKLNLPLKVEVQTAFRWGDAH